MKRLATAAALTLALLLTGCSSSASSVSPSPSASAAEVSAGVEGDFRGVELEEVISTLEAKDVPYKVRILDTEERYLQNPKATTEQGKWRCRGLMDPADGGEIFPRFINVGDTVVILVSPVGA